MSDSIRVINLEIRNEPTVNPELPYAVYDHEQYTPYPDQQKINYPVLVARFQNHNTAYEWALYVTEGGNEDECVHDAEDSMDGDHESALASAGWGTDEDYGGYNDGDY